MRAIVVDHWMEPQDLKVQEIDEPEVTPGAVLVEVKAVGANFFDILMVQGNYQVKPAFPFVPGAELAGIVREVGEGVEGIAVGDEILAATPLGGYAELARVPAASCWKMPAGMTFEEGASIPIVYPTSYAALHYRAQLRAGETLLVHAAAGGVGVAAVQLGKDLGAKVIATAGSADKLAIARREGADYGIDYRKEDFVEKVKEITGGRGADVIYDSVGGEIFDRSLKCIAWNGRLLVIGFASGKIPEVRANRILLKNIAVVGLHWGAYAIHEPQRIPETYRALFTLYEEGKIKPVIFDRFPLESLPEALGTLGSRRSYGKIIVTP